MSKLTKKQEADLTTVLAFMKKAKKFIEQDRIFICSNTLPNSLSYYDKDGNGITPMSKFVGSELCYLLNAIDRLESVLNPTVIVTEIQY